MIRVGLVGYGYFGRSHLNNLLRLEEKGIIHVVAVCDINPDALERARQFLGQQNKGAIITANFPEVLNSVDAVDVVANTPAHFPLLVQALKAGKHVFVEKPLAYTLREAKEIQRLSGEKKLKVGVGYIIDFSPAVGALIKFLAIHKDKGIHIISAYSEWVKKRIGDMRPTPGDLEDEATHPLRTILNVVENVSGKIQGLRVSTDLTFCDFVDKEAQKRLYGSLRAYYPPDELFEIFGSEEHFLRPNAKSVIRLRIIDYETKVLVRSSFVSEYQNRSIYFNLGLDGKVVARALLEFDVAGKDRLTINPFIPDLGKKVVLEETSDRLYDELKAFAGWVVTGDKDPRTATIEDGVRENTLLDACKRSFEKGEVIEINKL